MASTRHNKGMKKTSSPEERRRAELARIHIAKAEKGMSDDEYRYMLNTVAGVTSAADLDARGRRAVLDHLCGGKGTGPLGTSKGLSPSYPKRPKNMEGSSSRAAQLAKIEALLTVGGLPWSYADAIAKQMGLADKVAWVPDGDLYRIITALKVRAKKMGWDLSGERR